MEAGFGFLRDKAVDEDVEAREEWPLRRPGLRFLEPSMDPALALDIRLPRLPERLLPLFHGVATSLQSFRRRFPAQLEIPVPYASNSASDAPSLQQSSLPRPPPPPPPTYGWSGGRCWCGRGRDPWIDRKPVKDFRLRVSFTRWERGIREGRFFLVFQSRRDRGIRKRGSRHRFGKG